MIQLSSDPDGDSCFEASAEMVLSSSAHSSRLSAKCAIRRYASWSVGLCRAEGRGQTHARDHRRQRDRRHQQPVRLLRGPRPHIGGWQLQNAPACSYVSEFTRIAKGGELNFDRSCYAGEQCQAAAGSAEDILSAGRCNALHANRAAACRRRSRAVHPVDCGRWTASRCACLVRLLMLVVTVCRHDSLWKCEGI